MCTNTNSNAMYVSFSDFTLKAEQTGCLADSIVQQAVLSVGACAVYCRKLSHLFIFGRSGTNVCDNSSGKCKCVCKPVANHQGCVERHNPWFDLYQFNDDAHLQPGTKMGCKSLFALCLFKVKLTLHCQSSIDILGCLVFKIGIETA